ncbi:hypothetical protein AK812_SmicGene47573 [Symbiodinium microadriaticum]|uniref:Uncharacterized protein n=1 Tax=Symbiodinium microadriaticum TaxID=2951 RepID=A0A1Q9BRD1_SYMMI|nr:hypothetical protein AK812_SmicGene47573 [Symbiodinium microadriaticum]CAE7241515.1 unnamed protein product [Symbiodinium sp. KB8]
MQKADRSSAPSSKAKAPKKEKEEVSEAEKEEASEAEASPTAAPYASGSDDDNDDDVFQGDFKTKPEPEEGIDGRLAKLPSKLQSTIQTFDRQVLESIPTELSPADFGYWLLTLEKEALLKTEHFRLGLEGPLSGHLGTGKSNFLKMSLRARGMFDTWSLGMLRGLDEPAPVAAPVGEMETPARRPAIKKSGS